VKKASCLAAMIVLSRVVLGQSVLPVQEDLTPMIRSTSSLVMVPVLVRSASGELVTNLAPSDFKVTDNGVEQKVLEEASSGPFSVVVLMQTGGAAARQFQNYRTFNTLLSSMMGSSSHKVALVTFDSRIEEVWNFPPRIDGIKHAFKYPKSGDHGAAIMDALRCGIDLLREQSPAFRRVILLLSQPTDDGSKVSAEEIVRRLGESNTTVYSIMFPPGKGSGKDEQKQLPRAYAAQQTSANHGAIYASKALDFALTMMRDDTAAGAAEISGGESGRLRNKDDLDRTLSILANDFSNCYTLNFRPNSNEQGFHSIKVQVLNGHAHLRVAARTSYWRNDAANGG
jgi:VWFA-related protein